MRSPAAGAFVTFPTPDGRDRPMLGARLPRLAAAPDLVRGAGRRPGAVQRRTSEIGLGLALGIPAAYLTARLLGEFLYGVPLSDPAVFLGVAGGLALVALLACLVPGQRATGVDRLAALRAD